MPRSPADFNRDFNIALIIITSGRARNAPRSSCLFIRRCWPLSPFLLSKSAYLPHITLQPLLFLSARRRLNCTSAPPALALYLGNSVYCLLSYVVDPILPLLTPVSFLEAWHFGCRHMPPVALFRMFLFSVEILFFNIIPIYAIGRCSRRLEHECYASRGERELNPSGGMGGGLVLNDYVSFISLFCFVLCYIAVGLDDRYL